MKAKDGFTLVEVAMVVLIGGILLASASALLLTYFKKVQFNTTEKRLETIDEALQLFLNLNGRYPCPADPLAAVDTATFGVEEYDLVSETCNTPAEATGSGARPIQIGTVPVRTLNLPDDFIGDAWSGRFTYAVTEALAEAGTYDRNEGGITVIDSAGNNVVVPAGSGHYVVISHGTNNAGAASLQGGGVVPCTTGTLEEENCDGDDTFRSTLILGTANNAAYYDDLMNFRALSAFGDPLPDGAVVAFNLSTCPDGWVQFSSAEGRMILGAGGPYALNSDGGTADVSLSVDEIAHHRPADSLSPTALVPPATPGAVPFVMPLPTGTSTIDPADAHTNMPPYIALLYCEKT